MKLLKKILYVILSLIDVIALAVAILCLPLAVLPEFIGDTLTDQLIEAIHFSVSYDTILTVALVSMAIFFGLRYLILKVFKKHFLFGAEDDAPVEYLIRFEGVLSGESCDFVISKIKRNVLHIALLIGFPWVGIFSLLSIFIREFTLIFLLLNVIPIAVSLIFWIIASNPKRLEKSVPQSVFIEADKQFVKMKNKTLFKGSCRPFDSVKEVRDYGEFYQLTFPFDSASSLFVCQKDLLTVGTVEDFERLFKGKIVKMQAVQMNGTR